MQKLKHCKEGLGIRGNNKILRLFIVLSWLSGLFPIENPWTCNLEKIRFRKLHFVLLIPLIYLLYPLVVFSDIMRSNPRTTSSMTQTIIQHLHLTAGYAASFSFRLSALVYCKKTVQLIRLLQNFRSNPTFPTITKRDQLQYLLPFTVVYLINVVVQSLWVLQYVKDFYLKTVPTNQVLFTITIVFTQYSVISPSFFCLMFISYFGLELVAAHELVYGNLVAMLTLFQRLPKNYDTENVDKCHQRLLVTNVSLTSESFEIDNILDSFVQLKEAFQLYSRVAGTYCISLFFLGLTVILKNLGFLLSPDKYNAEWKIIPGLVLDIYCMGIILSMGSHIETQMERNRNYVQIAAGRLGGEADKRLLRLADILSSWEWSLTARGLFTINYGLVPGLAQAAVTYVIFIFQLQSTEKELERPP